MIAFLNLGGEEKKEEDRQIEKKESEVVLDKGGPFHLRGGGPSLMTTV